MPTLVAIAKAVGAPGSLGFLVLSATVCLIAAVSGSRGRVIARRWALLVGGIYVVAALPVVASSLETRLPAYAPLWRAEQAATSDALIVLSGDNPLGRARETRRILDQVTPRCVVVSGNRWFVRMLKETGVPTDGLIIDESGETTRDQIRQIGIWAERCQARRVVLVASRISMPRIVGLIKGSPLDIVLAPAPLDVEPVADGFRALVPSFSSLRLTRDALYERAALLYYRHKNWVQ